MCRIASIINTDKSTGESQIMQMLGRVEHGGDHNYEILSFDSAILATNRLAIVNEQLATQPITDKSKRYAICFNGEIYNFKKIRRELKKQGYSFSTLSDTETLLAGYIKWGAEKILDKINGMFAFVIFDDKIKNFFAARDPLGIKPLYYAQSTDNKIYFASEVKELSSFSNIKEIKELAPGHYLQNSLQPKKYFQLNQKRIYSNEEFVTKELRNLIDKAVKTRVDTKLPIGVMVSGGLDSTGILVTALKFHPNVTAIIVGAKNSEDALYAEKFCRENKIKYIKQIEPQKTWEKNWNNLIEQAIYAGETIEPNPIRNLPMNMIASNLAKKHGLKIVLLGEGADELFAGYPEFKDDTNPNSISKKIPRFVKDLHRTQLQRVDRASMFYTIENRVPFLDKNIVQFAMQIDPKLLLKIKSDGSIQEKYILRKALSDRLPKSIYNRPKLAFNAGTGMGSNGPDHKTQKYIENKYSDKEFSLDRKRLFREINFFHIQSKLETYLLKKCVDYGYDKAKFMKHRTTANAKNLTTPKTQMLNNQSYEQPN